MTMNTQEPAWIGWMGSRCPVAPGADCEVQFRNGYTSRGDDPEEWEWNRQYECRDFEIIAYRVWPPAWQAHAIAAGWSPPTAPDLQTVLAFESGQESMRGENDRLREALRVMIEGYAWEAMARRDNASDAHPEDDACVIQARQALRRAVNEWRNTHG